MNFLFGCRVLLLFLFDCIQAKRAARPIIQPIPPTISRGRTFFSRASANCCFMGVSSLVNSCRTISRTVFTSSVPCFALLSSTGEFVASSGRRYSSAVRSHSPRCPSPEFAMIRRSAFCSIAFWGGGNWNFPSLSVSTLRRTVSD